MPRTRTTSSSEAKRRAVALREGYRSGLEENVGEQLREAGVRAKYEEHCITYSQPSVIRKYTPDWVLSNGIVLETKGRFVTRDRQKHLLVKASHPDLDIRFIFSNSRQRISKTSRTTYAMWCEKHGFQFADKTVPTEWLQEPRCSERVAAIKQFRKDTR